MLEQPLRSAERRVRGLILGGQTHGVWVRSERVGARWHNALVFRREGKLSLAGEVVVGLAWHLAPDAAAEAAARLGEAELVGYFKRAMRPRPPI